MWLAFQIDCSVGEGVIDYAGLKRAQPVNLACGFPIYRFVG